MRLAKRLLCATAALACAIGLHHAAAAASAPQPLSPADAAHYAAAFNAVARGDFIDAQMQATGLQDSSLLGYLAYDQLMHPTAHKASFQELSAWLVKFRELPLAERVFDLAVRRKPAGAMEPPLPTVAGMIPARTSAAPISDRARRAREAFYSGDVERALALASRCDDRWIIGLAAYRLKSYEQALSALRDLAHDEDADAWSRSAAAFWSARAAAALGKSAEAVDQLRLAASAPQTFYGMIAVRQLKAQRALRAETTRARPQLQLASFSPATAAPDPSALVARDARAHRAAALAQIGRLQAAVNELRVGHAFARTADEQQAWVALALALGTPLNFAAPALAVANEDYPLPPLEPKGGFTLDKALVYAIVRQESRFDPTAVSNKGAVGLMQLTRDAAVRAAGDDKLARNMRPLYDPAFNLRVGQDYLSWLMDRAVGYDLLRVVAAYNGGPGMVQRTVQALGADAADPLLLMESLPAYETRNYVRRVMAGYWTYKTMFGEETPSLDAVAGGSAIIDARLDLANPTGPRTQFSGELLRPGLN